MHKTGVTSDIWVTATDSNPQPLSSYTNTLPFSQISLVWLDGFVFMYELSSCGFEFRCRQSWIYLENQALSLGLLKNQNYSHILQTIFCCWKKQEYVSYKHFSENITSKNFPVNFLLFFAECYCFLVFLVSSRHFLNSPKIWLLFFNLCIP